MILGAYYNNLLTISHCQKCISTTIVLLKNFHLFEVVSRYRDPQLQAGENYSYVFNLRSNIWKS